MNKEKIIEEMVKLCCFFKNGKCTAYQGIDNVCDMFCLFGKACEKLMSAGYRNCKDKVVLSIEEFDEDYVTKQDRDYWKNKAEILGNKLKQAHKETAKEIYSWLKEHTFDSSFEIIKTFFKEKYGVEE